MPLYLMCCSVRPCSAFFPLVLAMQAESVILERSTNKSVLIKPQASSNAVFRPFITFIFQPNVWLLSHFEAA